MLAAEVVYRVRAYDTPDDPFLDDTATPGFRYGDDLGLVVSDDGVIVDRGTVRRRGGHPSGGCRSSTCATASCCRGWWTPTSTSPRCG